MPSLLQTLTTILASASIGILNAVAYRYANDKIQLMFLRILNVSTPPVRPWRRPLGSYPADGSGEVPAQRPAQAGSARWPLPAALLLVRRPIGLATRLTAVLIDCQHERVSPRVRTVAPGRSDGSRGTSDGAPLGGRRGALRG
jgi:hypothetical protein